MLRFRVSESLSIDEFLRVGEAWANLIRLRLKEIDTDIDRTGRVLDFGCGCGRTARWFLPGAKSTEFCGVDVDADAIAWCRRHLSPGQFSVNAPAPPLPFPAEHFDVIYCLSVFTHLDESMQDLWFAELTRILKPDGILLLTVHGKVAAQSLDSLGREELQSVGFVHRRSPKLRSIVPDWYHTTWHSEEYIVKRLSARFREVRYCPISDSIQDMVVGRRKSAL